MEYIQITYDQQTACLEEETEYSIRSKLSLVLKKFNLEHRILSILFCSAETIQNLNTKYRETTKPTDILSWLYNEEEGLIEDAEKYLPWGELAVCLEISQDQAQNSGWSHDVEILRLLIHGLGHLMGFNHELSETEEAEALKLESEMLSLIGLEDIYP